MSTTKPPAVANGTPWVERYRPKSLKDVAHQTEVVATLQNAVETGRLPHLLFYGPPGSGKTSVALALCQQLWHPSQWKRRVLELNASDERGISVVRDKIKHFASLAVGQAGPRSQTSNPFASAPQDNDGTNDTTMENTNSYPNPPFKVVILDEADTVTPDAQAALRRIIEANSRITRFILICNYVTRIIQPLASRCAKYRFQALPVESMKFRLQTIASAEGCTINDSQLDFVLKVAEGDMRRAVQTLQTVSALLGTESISEESIAELAGLPPPKVVEDLIESLKSSSSVNNVTEVVEAICADGYSAQILIKCLLQKFVTMPKEILNDKGKAKLSIRLAEAEACMLDGADEYIQLLEVCVLATECLRETTLSGE